MILWELNLQELNKKTKSFNLIQYVFNYKIYCNTPPVVK